MTDGIKSSEFWLTIAVMALIAFAPKLGLTIPTDQLWALVVANVGYAASRSGTKMFSSKTTTGSGTPAPPTTP